MWYPDDLQHLNALSEHLTRWVLGWVRGHGVGQPRSGS